VELELVEAINLIGNGSYLFPTEFDEPALALTISSEEALQRDWVSAGFLNLLVEIDSQLFRFKTVKVQFGRSLLELPDLPCQIEFVPRDWVVDAQVKIYKVNDMPLQRSGSIGSAGAGTITTVTVGTTSTSVLAANGNRKGLQVLNTGNTSISLDVAATATVAGAMFTMAPGDYYEPPIPYTGSLSAIGSAAGGSLKVTEFV